MKYNREKIENAIIKKGYKYYDKGNYNLNIIGIRSFNASKSVTNIFDDILTLSYKENDTWIYKEYPITTDPGRKAVLQYTNPNGVAILCEDQYISSYIIRKHRNEYEALCQNKPVKVYRDRNKDIIFDYVDEVTGVFGINIHRSNPTTESTYVENWSEGCQVFKRVKDFNEFMIICNKAKDLYGNSFTYTLINSKDIS
jgi:hypothetical protein